MCAPGTGPGTRTGRGNQPTTRGRASVGNMSNETPNPVQNEDPVNNLTPNTDERSVSARQLSKWKGEGGALPADFDSDPEEQDPEQ